MTEERIGLIRKISESRNSNVICYVTSDRDNIGTRVAPDIIPVFYKHLELLDHSKPLDLILYTKGGDVLTALRLVNLIYEYTDRFSVLIPYRAYSSGTLICLGASEIVMGKMSELTPVDPKVTGIFNPNDPNNIHAKIPISVEDVSSYFTLGKEMIGISEDRSLTDLLAFLIEHVHPLAIGSVYRTHFLIRLVAEKLLLKHMNHGDQEKITNIVDQLTKNLHSHDYIITRQEAKEELQLQISYCDNQMEKNMWELFSQYQKLLELDEPFLPEHVADRNGNFYIIGGVIETVQKTDFFEFNGNIQQRRVDNTIHPEINIIKQGWVEQRRSHYHE